LFETSKEVFFAETSENVDFFKNSLTKCLPSLFSFEVFVLFMDGDGLHRRSSGTGILAWAFDGSVLCLFY